MLVDTGPTLVFAIDMVAVVVAITCSSRGCRHSSSEILCEPYDSSCSQFTGSLWRDPVVALVLVFVLFFLLLLVVCLAVLEEPPVL